MSTERRTVDSFAAFPRPREEAGRAEAALLEELVGAEVSRNPRVMLALITDLRDEEMVLGTLAAVNEIIPLDEKSALRDDQINTLSRIRARIERRPIELGELGGLYSTGRDRLGEHRDDIFRQFVPHNDSQYAEPNSMIRLQFSRRLTEGLAVIRGRAKELSPQ